MRSLGRMLGFVLAAILGWRRSAQRHAEELEGIPPGGRDVDPRRRHVPADPRAELLVALLLLLTGACGVAVVVLLIVEVANGTQWLGLAFGLGFGALAAALIVAGKRVVPQELAVEERPKFTDPEAVNETVEMVREGGEGISRRGLLAGAAGVAAVGIGGALIAPAASLGPNVANRIDDTPWRRGTRVVDARGRAILAADVVQGTFVTGYAEGASVRDVGSPIVLVRLDPSVLRLPAGRPLAEWAPQGLLAYSKICTHAACAISLYRYPSFRATQPRPALVCPCHYSTFDPARGAKVIFGPAGRSLPQLPLAIDAATGELRANGGFSGSIGPAWLDVDRGGQ
ncbi:MAG TPA: Rieske 2Fe-2S domain-containing protein [Conexibacter sp.]|jgi:ubiquinol-cytochrome c reductase iron-sulfur subunit